MKIIYKKLGNIFIKLELNWNAKKSKIVFNYFNGLNVNNLKECLQLKSTKIGIFIKMNIEAYTKIPSWISLTKEDYSEQDSQDMTNDTTIIIPPKNKSFKAQRYHFISSETAFRMIKKLKECGNNDDWKEWE